MNNIFAFGIIIFLGFLGAYLLSRLKVPAVTGYIIIGLLLGVSFLNIISPEVEARLDWLINLALLMIAFSVGGELKKKELAKMGRFIAWIVVSETIFAFLFIFGAVLLAGLDYKVALIIAALGSATAPAATVLVLNELRAKGPLTSTLLACVGIDDAMGITIYSIASSVVQALLSKGGFHMGMVVFSIIFDIVVSIVVGIVAGIVLVYLGKRVKYDTQAVIFTLGTLFFFTGPLYNTWHHYHFSPLLAAMATGFVFVNYSPHSRRIFRNLEFFAYPFYLVYFVLAGAKLQIRYFFKLGIVAIAYLVGRFLGKNAGVFIGGAIGKAPINVRKYAGLGLFSQAGIAIGLALFAANRFPMYSNTIIAIALGTTIITETLGPILTKIAVTRSGEAGGKSKTGGV